MNKPSKPKKQSVINVLVRARAYLKKGWTRKAFARDTKGESCGAREGKASCWCASGALERATGGTRAFKTFFAAETELKKTVGCDSIPTWNDDIAQTRTGVVRAFTRTIARLRRQKAL
jgi:hypothetical protein